MKDDGIIRLATCPKCGKTYTGRPALSREDNETMICPDCGILEALATLGISAEEQQESLTTIHRYSEGRTGDAH